MQYFRVNVHFRPHDNRHGISAAYACLGYYAKAIDHLRQIDYYHRCTDMTGKFYY